MLTLLLDVLLLSVATSDKTFLRYWVINGHGSKTETAFAIYAKLPVHFLGEDNQALNGQHGKWDDLGVLLDGGDMSGELPQNKIIPLSREVKETVAVEGAIADYIFTFCTECKISGLFYVSAVVYENEPNKLVTTAVEKYDISHLSLKGKKVLRLYDFFQFAVSKGKAGNDNPLYWLCCRTTIEAHDEALTYVKPNTLERTYTKLPGALMDKAQKVASSGVKNQQSPIFATEILEIELAVTVTLLIATCCGCCCMILGIFVYIIYNKHKK